MPSMNRELYGRFLPMVQNSKFLDRFTGFYWRFLQNHLPAARGPGRNVFRAIIQVENLGSTASRASLDHLVKFGFGLHRAVFVRQNVTIEIAKKRKIAANETYGQLVGV